MHVCPSGHEVRSAADRDADGWCKQCRLAKNATYRSRQRTALQLATELEARGLPITRSDPPVDIHQLAADLASGNEIRTEITMTDPQTLRQMLIEALMAGAQANEANKPPKADDGPDPGAEFAKFVGEHLNDQ
jgi:hypothetical protein